ncbi:MAG TPA: SMI1/KNR4 family protein [Archangium sp.]|uniref:SMI1/KNR4 family protein n=1 Tax=Archangium sp. TaxID=1872627 RepID=UPI002E334A3C|nr:SMI1/KNR4 family protein [Archangium sp.]HEX5749531.1 SMI1/KNR4 family protein [Archangium sp.]
MSYLLHTTEGGPPLNEEELRSFEIKNGFTFPVAYKAFLLTTNGGRPERDLFAITGLANNPFGRIHFFFGLNDPVESCNLDWNLDVFGDRIPDTMLPIATTEGVDKICLAVSGERSGEIFYWDGHAGASEKNLHFLASDFASFISSLRADENSPRFES